jgi:hypothetical protein
MGTPVWDRHSRVGRALLCGMGTPVWDGHSCVGRALLPVKEGGSYKDGQEWPSYVATNRRTGTPVWDGHSCPSISFAIIATARSCRTTEKGKQANALKVKAIGCQLSAIGYRLSAIGYRPENPSHCPRPLAES